MKRQLLITPEAEADILQAFAWYQEQRPGLGEEFLLGVEAGLAGVQRQPESYARVGGEVRRASLRRFPYGVFFLLDGP